MCLGMCIWSKPLRMMLYTFIGSEAEKGGLECNEVQINLELRGPHSRSSQQFVHETTKRPEVHSFVMTLVEDNLRSHVLRGPTEGPGLIAGVELLGETKVYQLDVTINS